MIEDGVSAKRVNSTVAIAELGGGQEEARRARRGGEARCRACLPERSVVRGFVGLLSGWNKNLSSARVTPLHFGGNVDKLSRLGE